MMARIDPCVFGKLHEFPERGSQGFPMAVWQIGPSAVPDEEGVSGEQLPLQVEGNTSRGMAWRVNDPNFKVSQGKPISIIQGEVHRLSIKRDIFSVHGHPGAAQGLQFGIGSGMVQVEMGVQDIVQRKPKLSDFFEDSLGFFSRVDDGPFVGLFTADDITKNIHGL